MKYLVMSLIAMPFTLLAAWLYDICEDPKNKTYGGQKR